MMTVGLSFGGVRAVLPPVIHITGLCSVTYAISEGFVDYEHLQGLWASQK